ncbi:MAG TPA: FAD-binding protein [Hyphomicrobiaceae bacterium]|nr:FAD-binding protein [Hyphomicrobiaceae bacterium]
MSLVVRPAADWELASFLTEASAKGSAVEILGGGSKADFGRPRVGDAHIISTHVLRGVRLYEPAELVMIARAGAQISEIERDLRSNRQMLAFEPIDLGPMLGKERGLTTIGGVFATNLSGSRRIAMGAARDNLLGVHAVSGAGEIFRSGGRVMKNVTGLDLCRAISGSWGTLAAMMEAAFKVVPEPEETATLVLLGLPDDLGVEALCAALASPLEVSGGVHLDAGLAGRLWQDDLSAVGESLTLLRLETFSAFLPDRVARLTEVLKLFGEVHVMDDGMSRQFWGEMRELSVFQGGEMPVWRISTTPTKAPFMVADIRRYMDCNACFDWSGGLVWLEVPVSADAGATDIRRVLAAHRGYATLVRAAPDVRRAVDVFQPMDPGIARMTRELKSVFDPAGILNPGRMYTTDRGL